MSNEVIEAYPPATWIKCSERMPESGQYVLAHLKNELGKGRRIRAFYAQQYTLESPGGDYDDFTDYNEENDCYYTPEGWYETNEYEETHWQVTDLVTHWMPLPEPPCL